MGLIKFESQIIIIALTQEIKQTNKLLQNFGISVFECDDQSKLSLDFLSSELSASVSAGDISVRKCIPKF